jgi:hypothetical protein
MNWSLFRRKQLWVPTLLGWLLLFVLIVIACAIGGRHIHAFLSSTAPAPAARLLVVEGWMEEQGLDQAVAAFHAGHYDRVITTGGAMEAWPAMFGNTTYADIAARYLKTHGLENVDVIAVPAPASAQERTFLSAVKVREWLAARNIRIDTLDVFSSGVHARRSHMLYRMAFGPKVNVGILAAEPSDYDQMHWWKTSAGAKSVMGETISLIWTVCCFYPPNPGSHAETWGEPTTPSAAR